MLHSVFYLYTIQHSAVKKKDHLKWAMKACCVWMTCPPANCRTMGEIFVTRSLEQTASGYFFSFSHVPVYFKENNHFKSPNDYQYFRLWLVVCVIYMFPPPPRQHVIVVIRQFSKLKNVSTFSKNWGWGQFKTKLLFYGGEGVFF